MKTHSIKLCCFIALFFTVLSAYSQSLPFSLEARGGINLSNIRNYNMDTKAGYRFEAVAKLKFESGLFIQSGINFSQKKNELEDEGVGDTDGDGRYDYAYIKNNLKTQYFHIPLMAGYKLGLTNDFSLNIAGGLYFGIGAGGKMESAIALKNSNIRLEDKDISELSPDDFTSSAEFHGGDYDAFGDGGLFKKCELGARAEIGAEYKRILLNAGYEFGFTDISKNKMSDNIYNRNFFVTLGFRIF